jgi:putative phosphoribosyl transferase
MTSPGSDAPDKREEIAVAVVAGAVTIPAKLVLPENATSVVLIARTDSGDRSKVRSEFVSRALAARGIGSLQLDLLTPREQSVHTVASQLTADAALLADRIGHAAGWLKGNASTAQLPAGCLGLSTGAPALIAAADRPDRILAVVSLDSRPDLAARALARVQSPTLLIAAELDPRSIGRNREALDRLHCEKELATVPGASRRFDEPGAFQTVAKLAAAWFSKYLRG